MPTMVEKADDDNLEEIVVDINKNFNMLTAFGSFPIVLLMESYIFDVVYPAVMHFFELRLQIKPNEKQFYIKFFAVI